MIARMRVPRSLFKNELIAGLVMAVVSVPGAVANGVLANTNPIYGVYSMIGGTTVAALFTGSVIMNVDSTSATSLAAGDTLATIPADQQLGYLVVLGLLVGAFMLAFGLLRLGFLTRFISNAVMTGFLSGLGLLTILGQVSGLTGYDSDASNKVSQTIDTLRHFSEWSLPTLIVGLVTMAVIYLASRTRYARFAFAIALVVGTLMVTLLPAFASVLTVGDTTTIPSGLPRLQIPDLSLIPAMLLPALTLAIIALVQASGVSQSVPNPDGEYPNPSTDFAGQGAGNLATGLIGGLPVGGSFSGTATLLSVGGHGRWSNLFSGVFAGVAVMFFGPQIENLPMPMLAGLLIMVGISMFNVPRIQSVWRTGPVPLTLMAITFVATIFLPIQSAVGVGVALTFLVQVYRSADKVRIERIVRLEDGGFAEAELPAELSSGETVVLVPVGSLFFAGAAEFEDHLPKVGQARRAVVIIRLRNRDEVGSTFVRIVERYAQKLKASDCKLILAGADPHVIDQLEKTGILDVMGRENVYAATRRLGEATERAWVDAQRWIEQGRGGVKPGAGGP